MPGGSDGPRAAAARPLATTGKTARFRPARRRDGLVGGGALSQVSPNRRSAAPRLRLHASSPLTGLAGTGSGASVGPEALPGLRRHGSLARPSARRLRMTGRRGDGLLGGSVLAARGRGAGHGGTRPAAPRFRARPVGRPRPQSGRRPRFAYRRWSVLSRLTRRHAGPRVSLARRPGGQA